MTTQPRRRIKSFVLRAGRTTAAQERALTELWPKYGVEFTGVHIDLNSVFMPTPGTPRPRCMEIGFGAGEVIGVLAQAYPGTDYLGIEVHRSGVGRLLLHAAEFELNNLRIICHDAVEVLGTAIADESFDEVLIFFPDPWHKKRHRKRRLVDQQFLALLCKKIMPGGTLRLATDWHEYAEQMLLAANATPTLVSLSADGTYVERPGFRPATRFEKRGERLGHGVWDLAYRKLAT